MKKGAADLLENQKLNPDFNREIDFTVTKTTGELFTDTFLFFRNHFRSIAWVAAIGAALFCFVAFTFAQTDPTQLFIFGEWMFGTLNALPQFFVNEYNNWLFAINTFVFTVVAFNVHNILDKEAPIFEEETIRPVNPLANSGF